MSDLSSAEKSGAPGTRVRCGGVSLEIDCVAELIAGESQHG
ncbi:hypothetical protein PMI34_03336 [Pseudomonas sp. GM74]|nr:hypothetical protein [Pseudomonas sp. GM74]EJM88478.1 hypothetical protein PMI34_03336 [Pseudomonas sp. GM74]